MATIREKKLTLRESMDVLRGGTKIATIRKTRFAPFRHRFSIEVVGAEHMVAQGDILHHEYDIRGQIERKEEAWLAATGAPADYLRTASKPKAAASVQG